MNKLPSYKRRRRADLCAFGSEFKERVRAIRLELGIPTEGFSKDRALFPNEASDWYKVHIRKAVGNIQYKDLPQYYWHFPKEFAELIENFGYSNQPCKAGFHPEVPLDRCAMNLVHEFDLPEDMVNEVKHHIVVGETSSLGLSSLLQLILVPMEGDDHTIEFLALVAGIDESTTQKDWDDVWRRIQEIKRLKGIKASPTTREHEKILLRDLTWWKWSREGLGGQTATEIADRWEKEHEGVVYSEDTVRAAIQRIDKTMRPIS